MVLGPMTLNIGYLDLDPLGSTVLEDSWDLAATMHISGPATLLIVRQRGFM